MLTPPICFDVRSCKSSCDSGTSHVTLLRQVRKRIRSRELATSVYSCKVSRGPEMEMLRHLARRASGLSRAMGKHQTRTSRVSWWRMTIISEGVVE